MARMGEYAEPRVETSRWPESPTPPQRRLVRRSDGLVKQAHLGAVAHGGVEAQAEEPGEQHRIATLDGLCQEPVGSQCSGGAAEAPEHHPDIALVDRPDSS